MAFPSECTSRVCNLPNAGLNKLWITLLQSASPGTSSVESHSHPRGGMSHDCDMIISHAHHMTPFCRYVYYFSDLLKGKLDIHGP